MIPSIEFYSKNGHFLVDGITSQTLVYEDQQCQEKVARDNIVRSHSIKDSNIILIGAEHLLYCDQLKITDNQIIVIEKNPLKLDFYKKRIGYIPNKIICISGNFGLFTPFNTIGPGLVADEAMDILVRLSKLDIDWGNPTIFLTVYQNPNEEPLDKALHENIGLVLDAKKFHLSQESEYKRYKQLNFPTEKTGRLVNGASDINLLKRFKMPNQDTLILDDIINNNSVIEQNLGYLNNRSLFFAKKTRIILNWIFLQQLTTITFKNLSVFLELGDLLFFGEMFDCININLIPCFTDWFQQQSSISSTGGKLFFPFFNNLKRQINVASILPHEGGCFKPPHAKVYNVPFSFRDPEISFEPPLEDPNLCPLDIAVIHNSRFRSIEFKEINELYEIAIDLGTNHNEKDVFDILQILHQDLSKEYYPLNSYTTKNTLQGIDYLFYIQTRVRWVLILLRNLANKYTIKIHGNGWEKVVPQKYVCPSTQNKQELQKIYRTSLVTLDFNPVYSTYPHSLNMIDAFVSGGLCLHLAPLYFDFESERLFKKDSLFYFSSMNELQNKIEYLVNNKDKRAGIIKGAQKLILDKGLNSYYPKEMVPLSNTIILPNSNQNPILIDIAKAYLLILLGIPGLAFIKFQNALIALDYNYMPLIIRAVKTGLLCGEREKALQIFKKGFEKHPTNEMLLNYFNSIKDELLK
ncbi:MAG: hypothetical protein ACD_73C00822G0001 [uncultured bacterium]|nr:MAG: hypothetical protein ACD_73C00822G0001 [uncultured bacterium]